MAVFRLLEFGRRLFRYSSTDFSPPAISQDQATLAVEPLTSTERLSRYVFNRKYVNTERVHFRAFELQADAVELSVFRTENLAEEEVWTHGDTWAVGESTRAIVGRGDFTSSQLGELREDGHILTESLRSIPLATQT